MDQETDMQDTLAPPAAGLAATPPARPHAVAPTTPRTPWVERAFWLLERVLALGFIGAVLLNTANVFGRYVLGQSMIGAEEVQTYLMVAMTFFGAAAVAWRGRELRMDVLLRRLPAGGARGVRWVERVVMAVCCGFTAWQSGRYAWQMGQLGVHSDGAEIPMWLPHGAVAAGLALVALIAAVRVIRPPRQVDEDRVLH
jgi:TRAP-type C4-dicarboxylate transport system permease small subunit